MISEVRQITEHVVGSPRVNNGNTGNGSEGFRFRFRFGFGDFEFRLNEGCCGECSVCIRLLLFLLHCEHFVALVSVMTLFLAVSASYYSFGFFRSTTTMFFVTSSSS